jgi:hypothetical protein
MDLKQITRDNVKQLEIIWNYADLPLAEISSTPSSWTASCTWWPKAIVSSRWMPPQATSSGAAFLSPG